MAIIVVKMTKTTARIVITRLLDWVDLFNSITLSRNSLKA